MYKNHLNIFLLKIYILYLKEKIGEITEVHRSFAFLKINKIILINIGQHAI